MTLTITDMGDEWMYSDYSITWDRFAGVSVSVDGRIDKVPWMYADLVDVHAVSGDFEESFRGLVCNDYELDKVESGVYVNDLRISESEF